MSSTLFGGRAAASNTPAEPFPSSGLRAGPAVCADRGFSDSTLYRMGRRGEVRLTNINGRVYVDMASLAEYDRRALAGEFAQKPAGAAAKAAKARSAKLAGKEVA